MDGIADYRFLSSLGDAAHGHLYLADRPARVAGPGPQVAVKVVVGATADAFRRFSRELQNYAGLQSPYLVQLLDAGQQADTFFSVREYLELGTLENPARELTREEKLRAVQHAALAAHALHEAGVAHRDIRPATIWLHETGAKLGDLGLAQAADGSAQVTTMVAKPIAVAYLDPACISNDAPSRAADIYALGMTLHVALTGKTVFGDIPDDPILAIRAVINGSREVSDMLAPNEADLIRACIASDLNTRPETAAELADKIKALGAA
jgi:eukaryotic-like serine/threonine-protein kinase